ncbi:DUF1002 domain-containing protein [Bacillus thuringiensis]|uniref:DUF1002 domain-containing protein n=1 Tax=Bacillus thuringiensis TaxID=1428 RepID=UPI000BFE6175|nr:DUF1002 domain-containing protein [Bacillus thuringiensis]PGT89844.1 hypothetical protein COD17_08835 [Bacillus thuringiensis]
MFKKKLLTGMTLALLVSPFGGSLAKAETNDTIKKDGVMHETWSEPVFVKGISLTDAQLSQVKKDLEVKDDYKTLTMDGTKLVELLGEGDKSSRIFSSVVVQKTDKGDGVKVDIKTPKNITKVTKDQYRNASLTAGLTDVNIEVASSVPATGEGALAGVYYAFKEKGIELNQKDMKVAQEEVKMLGDINAQNKDKKGFTDEQLNVAIAEMKAEIAKLSEEQRKQLTKEDIAKIVNDELKKLQLDQTVTDKQKDVIVNFIFNFKDSPVANNKEIVGQLDQYKESVVNGAKDTFGKIKGFVESEEGKGFLASIKDFFVSIWNALVGLFS